MRIVFATLYDARDVNRGSGSSYFFTQELVRQGHAVEYVGSVQPPVPLPTRALRKLSRMAGKKYRSNQDIFMSWRVGRAITQRLNNTSGDVIITNDFSIAGGIKTSQPVILYTDAMFPHDYNKNQHPWMDNLSRVNVLFAQWLTRRGLMNADLCIFAAEFAREEALHYGSNPDKTYCIPYGANFTNHPQKQITTSRTALKGTHSEPVQLLFVGKYWDLKGGEIAIKTVDELSQRGISAVLHVVGPDHIPGEAVARCVFHGYLDKSHEQDKDALHELYESCDIMFLPSAAEGFGVAYVEAAAYGMPSLAYETTGVRTSVKHGTSGILLPLGADPSSFADVIESWAHDDATYLRFVAGARRYFEETVNWTVAVKALLRVISAAGLLKKAAE